MADTVNEGLQRAVGELRDSNKRFNSAVSDLSKSVGGLQNLGPTLAKDLKLDTLAGSLSQLPFAGLASSIGSAVFQKMRQKKEDKLLAKQLGLTTSQISYQRKVQETLKAREAQFDSLKSAAETLGFNAEKIGSLSDEGIAEITRGADQIARTAETRFKSLTSGTESGAAAQEIAAKQEAKDQQQITLLENIGAGITDLGSKFADAMKTGGSMGLGAIAALIAAPVVALGSFFTTLKAEFAILKTFTTGGLARIGGILKTFFVSLDTFLFGPEAKVLQGAGAKIGQLFTSIGNILGKLNPMNIPGMAKAGDAMSDAVSFVTKIINSIKTALAPIKTGFLAMEGAMSVFKPIMAFAKTLGTVLGKIFLPITVLMSVFDFVTGFMDGYDEGGIIGGIEGGITKLLQGLIGMPLDLLKSAVEWIGGVLGFDMSFMADFSFSKLIGDSIGFIFDMLKGAVNWIGTLFTDPVAALQALWTGLLGGYDSLISFITWPIDAAINWIMGLFGWSDPEGEPFSLWGTIKSALNSVWEWLAGLFDFDLGNAIEGLLPSWTPGWVKSALGLGGGDDEEDSTEPPPQMGEGEIQAYRDALAAAYDRIARSEAGENVYTGPDFIGASVDREAIEQIEALLANAEARAMGGPIKSGNPYLVGEQGPELILPSQDGQVLTANRTNQLLQAGLDNATASASAAPIVINQGGTTVNNAKTSTMPLPIPVSNRNVAWQGTDF